MILKKIKMPQLTRFLFTVQICAKVHFFIHRLRELLEISVFLVVLLVRGCQPYIIMFNRSGPISVHKIYFWRNLT